MGKENRFMPTEEFVLFDNFEDGQMYWSYSENEVTHVTCLTIMFIRNTPNIKNPFLKEMIVKRGLGYLDSKDYIGNLEVADKKGIFESLEFWDPRYDTLVDCVEESKEEFKKIIEEVDEVA